MQHVRFFLINVNDKKPITKKGEQRRSLHDTYCQEAIQTNFGNDRRTPGVLPKLRQRRKRNGWMILIQVV